MNNYELVECLKCKNTFEQTASLENVICIQKEVNDNEQKGKYHTRHKRFKR